ncbi:MAG: dynamin family protein [Acidimicrobiia bacterium]|nr:dynamin family protein [Acidimicrobiia bacterium]
MAKPDPNGDVRAVLDLAMKAASAYERPDFAHRLNTMLARVNRPDVQVVAIGEFKQGKSSLVNALVNVNICPVDDDIATAVHTIVRYGDERRAFALVKPASDPDGDGQRVAIDFDQIRQYATELGGTDPSLLVKGVEIEIPRKLLGDGVILVDTPGVGGLGSAHAAAGLGALSIADAAMFISDASQEYTRAEMDYLAQAIEMCPSVVCVMTKTDLYPRWRDVLEINQGHLARLGMSRPIIPVSSLLRVEAIRRKDKEINKQSGFPSLVQYITNDIVAANAQRNRLNAQRDVISVCDQLSGQFEAQRKALDDPEASAALVSGLEQAKARAESLRSQVAKWNVTLNDGIADLTSDVDFDLRGRIRGLLAEADKAIEGFDPADSWDEFEPWLENAMSQAVVANYRYLTERTSELSREVDEHFGSDGQDILADLEIHNAAQAMSRVGVDPSIDAEAMESGSRGLSALRGSYSGFLMVGILGGLPFVAVPALLVTGLGLGAGALLGRKGVKDEKERALTRRRSEAKSTVRRYCDEVSFQIGKDSRDTLRRIQRQLRDHYGSLADELNRSSTDALKSATEAANVAKADRSKKLRDVTAELERIKGLRDRAVKLAPSAVPPAP